MFTVNLWTCKYDQVSEKFLFNDKSELVLNKLFATGFPERLFDDDISCFVLRYNIGKRARRQDGKISNTQGKDFWSPTSLRRVGDQ